MGEQPEPEPGPEPEDGVPGLEEILRASQGITPDMDGAISAMAAIHAQWRTAWRDTGAFSDEETFELVRILVAASAGGIRALGLSWLPEGRTSHRRPESYAVKCDPGQEREKRTRRALPPDSAGHRAGSNESLADCNRSGSRAILRVAAGLDVPGPGR